MINNLYIDGENARSRFGVWVTRGGYNDLLTFPALKEPEENDWPEEDGVEVDLSDPKLEEKEITLTFLADTNTAATDLVAYLGQVREDVLSEEKSTVFSPKKYDFSRQKVRLSEDESTTLPRAAHLFRIPSLNREWRLRLSDHPSNAVYPIQTAFSLKFVEDVPARPVAAGLPTPGVRLPESRYQLDGTPFSSYGVVIDISRSALLKAPAAKLNMNRKVQTEDGQIYDADHLVFQKKEATFNCHFKAVSIEAFWACYDAFFAALIQPGERQLYVEEIGKAFPCYYKNSSAFKVLTIAGPVVVSFGLTLVFTRFRLEGGIKI